MRSGLFIAALFTSQTALAEPAVLTHQGRLLGVDGTATNGPTDITVSLYADETGGSAFWLHSFDDVPVDDGYFAVRLTTSDNGTALDSLDFADGSVWIETGVGGQVIGGRQLIGHTPYAIMSGGVRLPEVAAGSCGVDGVLGFDAASGSVLLCYNGEFTPITEALPQPSSADIVGVRNPGQSAEWALLRMTETTTIANVDDARALCVAQGLGLPSSSETNINCQGHIGTPRYVVTTRCNMHSDTGDTWATNSAIFQASLDSGQAYLLSYNLSNNVAHWSQLSCRTAVAGERSNDVCPIDANVSGTITLQAGDWLTCARPI